MDEWAWLWNECTWKKTHDEVLEIHNCSRLIFFQHLTKTNVKAMMDPSLTDEKSGNWKPKRRKKNANAKLHPGGIMAIWNKWSRWWILPSICSWRKLHETQSGGDQILLKRETAPQLVLEHLVFHLHLGMRQLVSFKLYVHLLDCRPARSHLWLSHNQESPSDNMLFLALPWNRIPEQLTWKFTIRQLLKFSLGLWRLF